MLLIHFVRESLLQKTNKGFLLEISPDSSLEDTGDPEFESPTYDGGLERTSLTDILGKRFAFEEEGEPAFQVAAENSESDLLIIMPYPVDNIEVEDVETQYVHNPANDGTDYGEEGVGSASWSGSMGSGEFINKTAIVFDKKLDAKPISLDSDILDNLMNKAGWDVDDKLFDAILASIRIVNFVDGDVLPNTFLMKRDTSKLKAPKRISTEAGIEKVAKFECTKPASEVALSLIDIVPLIDIKDINNIEWSSNAACWYEYANSPEKAAMAGVFAIVIAGLLAPETLGGSFLAYLTVLGTGMTIQDALCRVPVIIWAGATKRWKFAAANLVYLVVIIVFETLAKFKSARVGLKTAEITGIQAVTQSGKLELGASTLMKTLKSSGVPSMTAEKFAEVIKRSTGQGLKGWFIEDTKLAGELYEAIDRMDVWTVTKITLVGVVLQLASGLFGDSGAEALKTQIDAFLESEINFQALLEADAEMMEYAASIRKKYPER